MAREGQHDAQLRVRGDTKSADRDLARLGNRVNTLEGKVSKANKSLPQMGAHFSVVANQSLEMGKKVLGAAQGVLRFLDSTTKATAEIGVWANRMGVAAGALQELRIAGELTGASSDNVTEAVKTLRENLGEMERLGTGPAVDSLATLGLKLEDIANLPAKQQVEVLAKAMRGLANDGQRTSVAIELMGEDGNALIPMLRDGAAGVRALTREAREMGAVLDQDSIRKSQEMQRELVALEKRSKALETEIALKLTPAFIELGDAAMRVARLGDETDDFFKELRDLAVRTMDDIGLSTEQAAESASVFDQIWENTLDNLSIRSITGLGPAIDAFDNLEKGADEAAESLERVEARGLPFQKQMLSAANAADALTASLTRLAGQAAADNANAALAAGAMLHAITNVETRARSARREVSELERLLGRGADIRFEEMAKRTQDAQEAQSDLDDLLAGGAANEDPAANFRRLGELKVEAEREHQAQILDIRMANIERQREAGVDPLLLIEKEKNAKLAMLDFEAEHATRKADIDRINEERAQALHEHELARDAAKRASKKELLATVVATTAAGNQINRNAAGMASQIADLTIKNDEKRARFKQKVAGIEAISIGVLETVKAAAALASFNYVQFALHTSAAALAYTQGGILLSGALPTGAGGGISAGGAAAANGPPTGAGGGGSGQPESPIPPSSPGAAPRNNEEPSPQSPAANGPAVQVNIGEIHGDATDDFATKLAHRTRDLIRSGRLEAS